MLKNILTLLFLLFGVTTAFSQSVDVSYNPDYYHQIDRLEIKSGKLSASQSSVKPLSRKDIVAITDTTLHRETLNLSAKDFNNIVYLQNDNWEWLGEKQQIQAKSKNPISKQIFAYKSDVYGTQAPDYDIHVSPTFNFGQILDPETSAESHVINSRGIEVRGSIGKKIGFFSQFSDNQVSGYPIYVQNWTNQYQSFPNEGFWKKSANGNAADFITARGYITFQPIKQVQVKFGHDKNFIGSGVRSMILSDFSAPYLFLKLNTQIGRLQYTNLFAEMANRQAVDPTMSNTVIPKKFFAYHRLGINLGKKMNIGFSESIVFGRDEKIYELNYLNPIIFYRFAEGHIGSPDNSLIGIDAKINLFKRMSIYGQFMLDEFYYQYLKESSQTWLNKIAFQVGVKYIDVLSIPTLDFQMEWNLARPYTYSHFSSYSNYMHYNQPLAHPLGGNFSEKIVVLRYQLGKKMFLSSHFVSAKFGEDFPNQNWGGDIRKDYYTGQLNAQNVVGQGRKTTTFLVNPRASYMLRHNLFFDAQIINRNYTSEDESLNSRSNTVLLNIRWNMPNRQWYF